MEHKLNRRSLLKLGLIGGLIGLVYWLLPKNNPNGNTLISSSSDEVLDKVKKLIEEGKYSAARIILDDYKTEDLKKIKTKAYLKGIVVLDTELNKFKENFGELRFRPMYVHSSVPNGSQLDDILEEVDNITELLTPEQRLEIYVKGGWLIRNGKTLSNYRITDTFKDGLITAYSTTVDKDEKRGLYKHGLQTILYLEEVVIVGDPVLSNEYGSGLMMLIPLAKKIEKKWKIDFGAFDSKTKKLKYYPTD